MRPGDPAAMSAFDDLPHEQKLECLLALATDALAHYELPGVLRPVLINLSENATYRIEDPDTAGAGRFASIATATTRPMPSPRSWLGSRRSATTAWW